MRRHAAVIALLLVPVSARAQATGASVPPVLPKPLTSAKALFIGMGNTALPQQSQSLAAMLYPRMLQAFANGPYTLTQDPAKADLVGVVSLETVVSDVSQGSSFSSTFVRLTLLDRQTRSTLWVLNEDLRGTFRQASLEKYLDITVGKLVVDVQSLAAGKLP